MEAENILFALLRTAVCGNEADEGLKAACTPENLQAAYTLAKRHALAHLVGQAVSKLDLPENEALTRCRQAAMQAVYRYVQLDYAFAQICQTLEEAKIPFIPLKGSVLRDYYPEAWMRTSCDIDILVHECNLDLAAKALVESLGYRTDEKTGHDLSLYSQDGIHLELHYTILEETQVVRSQVVLEKFWDGAVPHPQKQYCLQLTDEMFYFYHIAHMAKHVESGGCGIRSFLDLWVLNHRVDSDRQKRETLLVEGSLMKFARAAESLSECWFSGTEKDVSSVQFENFILKGGTYGTLKNKVAVQQRKKNGRLQYALSRIFLPYQKIRFHYPILERHKWLTPVFQVVRWCKLLFKGGAKRSLRELQVNAQISQEEKMSAENLLEYLGLE